MPVKEILDEFIDKHKETIDTFDKLKNALKEMQTDIIAKHISDNHFDEAKSIVSELDQFNRLTYTSNLSSLLNEVKERFDLVPEKHQELIPKNSPPSPDFELSKTDLKVIKTIGKQGKIRFNEIQELANDESLNVLLNQEILQKDDISSGELAYELFSLTDKGSQLFESNFHTKPSDENYKKILSRYKDETLAFFFYDIETALIDKGFVIHSINTENNFIEVFKDQFHYFLFPDWGTFSKKEYFDLLDQHFEWFNLGFICVNEHVLENAKSITDSWLEENKENGKCKFLNINLTTIESFKNEENVFEILTK